MNYFLELRFATEGFRDQWYKYYRDNHYTVTEDEDKGLSYFSVVLAFLSIPTRKTAINGFLDSAGGTTISGNVDDDGRVVIGHNLPAS